MVHSLSLSHTALSLAHTDTHMHTHFSHVFTHTQQMREGLRAGAAMEGGGLDMRGKRGTTSFDSEGCV